jgi:glycosyltransferase involved in cell wall biosynthesis
MKILWFTNTSSLYKESSKNFGGGWIDSLEMLLKESTEINLAIAFFHKTDYQKLNKNNTTYYPILRKSGKKSPIKSVLNNYLGKEEHENQYLPEMLKVIDDFNPDVIHVFGTEEVFSVIQYHTKKPVIIQIQGLMNPCFNNYFPPGISQNDFILNFKYLKQNLIGSSPYFNYKKFKVKAKRESKILKESKYLIGRTAWDKKVVSLFAPKAHYFHVDEALRSIFYNTQTKNHVKNQTITILSTLSAVTYKGLDVILKTANILKANSDVSFEWNVVGVEYNNLLVNFFERKLNLNCRENNIKFLGMQSSNEISELILNSDLYIHPSYIDNSPNSVCEAQIMGLPIIACDVGGVSSIIENNKTGVLVPSNGTYEIACKIKDYNDKPASFFVLAKNGRLIAMNRHDKKLIKIELINCYKYLKDNA